MSKLVQGAVAEFLGVFALVFFGAGAILLTQLQSMTGPGALLIVALAHGLALTVFITGALHISGGQFNPAVSIGLKLIGKQPPKQAGVFIAAQLLGAVSAAGMLRLGLGQGANSDQLGTNLGATIGSLTDLGAWPQVFLFEALLTFALMFSVLWCLTDDRAHRLGGLPVGLTVMICILMAGPLTGASMNPARTFGPAVYGHWNMHWVYWLAPIIGASAAALLRRVVFEPKTIG